LPIGRKGSRLELFSPFVAPLRELQGIIGAHEWRKKGVPVAALKESKGPPISRLFAAADGGDCADACLHSVLAGGRRDMAMAHPRASQRPCAPRSGNAFASSHAEHLPRHQSGRFVTRPTRQRR